MERIIKEAIVAVGAFTNRHGEEPFLIHIKNQILGRIFMEEWRPMHEMNASKEMYAASNNYLKSAVKDAAIQAASMGADKVIKGVTGKLNSKSALLFKDRIAKTGFSVRGDAQNIGKETYNYTAKFGLTLKNSNLARNISLKGMGAKTHASVSLVEFNAIDFVKDKGIENIADKTIKTNEYKSFNALDYNPNYSPVMNAAMGTADIVMDYIPLASLAKTITNVGFNTALSAQTYFTAKRMEKIETASNEAERAFNAKLTQTIYDDMNFLSFEDTEALIRLCGMGELIK